MQWTLCEHMRGSRDDEARRITHSSPSRLRVVLGNRVVMVGVRQFELPLAINTL